MNKIFRKSLILVVTVSTLLLVHACNSGGGGSGGGGGGETKRDQAEIVKLVLSIGESGETVDFSAGTDVTLDYQGEGSVTVTEITLSAGATADISQDATLEDITEGLTIVVTAENGSTKKTYRVRFQQLSSEALVTFVEFKIAGEIYRVDFSSDIYEQRIEGYLYGTDSAQLTNIGLSAGASSSPAVDETFDLANNKKLIITVTSQYGDTSNDYTIVFVEAPASQLSNIDTLELTVANQSRTVDFSGDGATLTYLDTTPDSVMITRIKLSTGAAAIADGSTDPLQNGTTIDVINDKIIIDVTAQDGINKTKYTITFVKGNPSAADIESLTLNFAGSNKIVNFGDGVTEASVDYPFGSEPPSSVDIVSISLSAGARSDAGSTVGVTDGKITIEVTAQDGSITRKYTISFTKAKNTQANIESLTLRFAGSDETVNFGDGTEASVDYPFDSGVPESVEIVNISLSAEATSDAGSTVGVANGKITIVVTAQDVSISKTYTISFTEAKNTQANIESLTLRFTGTDAERTVNFGDGTEAIVGYPFGSERPSSVDIVNISLSAGATSDADSTVDITGGPITIVVTAQDVSISKTYTISFTEAKNTQANIESLTITLINGDYRSDHTVDFKGTTSTTINYPYGAGALTALTIKVKDISISDKASATHGENGVSVETDTELSPPANSDTVTILVTAENTDYSSDYSFSLKRSVANTEAEIVVLTLNVGGFEQLASFTGEATAILKYLVGSDIPLDVSIASIELSTGATATVGSASFDTEGDSTSINPSDPLTITVTAEDESTDQTYRINFVETERPGLRNVISRSNGGDESGLGSVPYNLSIYDELTRAVLAPYAGGANVHAIYVTIDGAGKMDGTSWSDAVLGSGSQLERILREISGNTGDDIYLLLIASSVNAPYQSSGGLNMKNYVAIVGGWDASGSWDRSGTTVLSGGGNSWVIRNIQNADNPLTSTAVLYGVSIEDASSANFGGGVVNWYSSPVLTNVTIANNSTNLRGGGIYNRHSSPVLTNVTIEDNSADDYGGGIYNEHSSPILTNVTIANNSAGILGGGIFSTNSSPILTNVTILDNSAADSGGGIYNSTDSVTVLTNVTIANNRAANSGGGIYSGGGSSPVLTNVTIFNNSADYGGGIYSYKSSHVLNNVTIVSNSSTYGGGIYSQASRAVIVNSIFWYNIATATASRKGPQIYSDGGTMTLAYSVLQGGDGEISNLNSTIMTSGISTSDPTLSDDLTTDGGSFAVPVLTIGESGSAYGLGVHIRLDSDANYYYSENGNDWHTEFSSVTGITGPTVNPPADSIDLTATDATGRARGEGRPDAGAYEYASEDGINTKPLHPAE